MVRGSWRSTLPAAWARRSPTADCRCTSSRLVAWRWRRSPRRSGRSAGRQRASAGDPPCQSRAAVAGHGAARGPPPVEEAQVDDGMLGMWWDPTRQARRRGWAFVMVRARFASGCGGRGPRPRRPRPRRAAPGVQVAEARAQLEARVGGPRTQDGRTSLVNRSVANASSSSGAGARRCSRQLRRPRGRRLTVDVLTHDGSLEGVCTFEGCWTVRL